MDVVYLPAPGVGEKERFSPSFKMRYFINSISANPDFNVPSTAGEKLENGHAILIRTH